MSLGVALGGGDGGRTDNPLPHMGRGGISQPGRVFLGLSVGAYTLQLHAHTVSHFCSGSLAAIDSHNMQASSRLLSSLALEVPAFVTWSHNDVLLALLQICQQSELARQL